MEISGQVHISAALPPKRDTSTYWIGGRVGPEPIWKFWKSEKSLTPTGIRNSGWSTPWPSHCSNYPMYSYFKIITSHSPLRSVFAIMEPLPFATQTHIAYLFQYYHKPFLLQLRHISKRNFSFFTLGIQSSRFRSKPDF